MGKLFTKKQLQDFKKYEKVRRSGKFNMLMDAPNAAQEAGLTRTAYCNVIRFYGFLEKEVINIYGSVDAFMAQ